MSDTAPPNGICATARDNTEANELNLRYTIGGAILAALTAPAAVAPAHAQRTPLYQSGTMVPGDVINNVSNGIAARAGDVSGDAFGRGVNPFAVTDSSELGLCSNTAATDGAYRRICIGHEPDGDALLSIDAMGGATATAFRIRVDGAYLAVDAPAASTPLNKTGNYTIESADYGRGFTNAAAVANIDLTLETGAVTGHNCFYVVEPWRVRIVAPGTDQIATEGGMSAAGGNVASVVPNSTICLTLLSTGVWMATSSTGLWTVN
jgi:hypothetical protein